LEETVDILNLPKFDAQANIQADPTLVKIPNQIEDQLRSCVAAIASTYRENLFHNF
jgi:hypothetical protein